MVRCPATKEVAMLHTKQNFWAIIVKTDGKEYAANVMPPHPQFFTVLLCDSKELAEHAIEIHKSQPELYSPPYGEERVIPVTVEVREEA
jgi:hypothetical protein